MGHWLRGVAVEGVMGRFCSGSVASSPMRKPSLRSGSGLGGGGRRGEMVWVVTSSRAGVEFAF